VNARGVVIAIVVLGCRSSQSPAKPPPEAGPRAIALDAGSSIDAMTAPVDVGLSAQDIEQIEEALRVSGEFPQRLAALSRDQHVGLVQRASCPTALDAARLLARRGDASHLPRRPAADDAAAIGRALCLIAQVEDATERRDFLRAYLPPTGAIAWSAEDCPGDHGNEKGGITEGTFTRAKATGRELSDAFVHFEGCRPAAAGEHVCTGAGRGSTVKVTLAPGPDGRLYISRIARNLNTGCS
jgi:hypothetical protein